MTKKYAIMYIQIGMSPIDANIGKVFLSKTGKTLTYEGRELQSLKGNGYKTNYFNTETGVEYWISNPRKDGNDSLYHCTIHVDEDIRAEYWTTVRGMPERKNQESFKSRGKHRVGRQDLKNKVGNH